MVLSSSRSTAYLLRVVPHRIDRAFNSSGATQAVTLDIYKRLFTGFGMLVFFTTVRSMEFQVTWLVLFPLFSVIDSFVWF